MQKILWNKSENIIHKFENSKEDFHIIPTTNTITKFGTIIKNSEISFTFDIKQANVDIECYFLIPAIENQNVKLCLQTNFESSNTKVNINVFALASNQASITLNGNLHILDGINKVEAKLYEETLLIGDAKYISMVPGLRVDSPDVIASHGAKIQRIPLERIFYMQSRGLDENKAIDMIINSYSQQIISKLELNEQKQSEFYSMIK